MNLIEKSLAVNELFKDLEIETAQFSTSSGLHCLSGCGHCCANPKVPATVLEFLPLAFHLYQTGRAEEALSQLDQTTEDSYCIVLNQLTRGGGGGRCQEYQHRGLICRLFGSAARRNRQGIKELITCKLIKEQQKEQYEAVTVNIQNGMDIPVSADYYTRLYAIDFHLAGQSYPINVAIKKALEAVLSYYFYFEGQAI